MATRSEQINELAAALSKAQREMENPHFDRENTFFNNAKYATLASVRDAVIPKLAEHGLSLIQSPKYTEGMAGCEWFLMHSSGQFQSGELMLPISKKDAQGVGGAVTYARRYTLQAIAGVAGEPDDDGNTASEKAEPQRQPARKEVTKVPKPEHKPEVQFVNDYEPVSKFFHDAGCKSADDATLVAKFCCASANLSKAQKDSVHAKEIYTGIEMALIEHKTPSAVLAAAKKLASSPV